MYADTCIQTPESAPSCVASVLLQPPLGMPYGCAHSYSRQTSTEFCTQRCSRHHTM